MEKINICAKIKNAEPNCYEVNTIGVKKSNTIKYKDNESEVYVKIYKEKIVIHRKKQKEIVKLEFKYGKTNKSYIKTTEIGYKIPIDVETKNIIINENSIYIEYNINDEKFEYNISWRC